MALGVPSSLFFQILTIILFCLFLVPQARSSTDITFSGFDDASTALNNLKLEGDASIIGNALQLTKNFSDNLGHATYNQIIHLWDRSSNKLADVDTTFDFIIDGPKASHGDGLAFFIAPPDYTIPQAYAAGGYLGLFHKETAQDPSKNRVVAVEIDTSQDQWDVDDKHIAIDVNSIRSVAAEKIPVDCKEDEFKGTVRIRYDSKKTQLRAEMTVRCSSGATIQPVPTVTYGVDLRNTLPEFVKVGFSAATGTKTEVHKIVSWSFKSNL